MFASLGGWPMSLRPLTKQQFSRKGYHFCFPSFRYYFCRTSVFFFSSNTLTHFRLLPLYGVLKGNPFFFFLLFFNPSLAQCALHYPQFSLLRHPRHYLEHISKEPCRGLWYLTRGHEGFILEDTSGRSLRCSYHFYGHFPVNSKLY